MKLLTIEEERFCIEMASSVDHVEAYRKNFANAHVLTKRQIGEVARKLLKKKDVVERIKELRTMTARALVMTGSKVIDEWAKIALADVSELVQYQRNNCRHCNGKDGAYQWVDEEEFAHALAVAIDSEKKVLPEDKGGYGFRVNGNVNKSCLKCAGEGLERLFVEDVRNLSPEGKKLYAGVKMTNAGPEIKTRDQDAALLNLAKYFKLLAPEDKSESSGANIEINITGGLPQ